MVKKDVYTHEDVENIMQELKESPKFQRNFLNMSILSRMEEGDLSKQKGTLLTMVVTFCDKERNYNNYLNKVEIREAFLEVLEDTYMNEHWMENHSANPEIIKGGTTLCHITNLYRGSYESIVKGSDGEYYQYYEIAKYSDSPNYVSIKKATQDQVIYKIEYIMNPEEVPLDYVLSIDSKKLCEEAMNMTCKKRGKSR